MTKYLEYDYTDDNGTVHHVKEALEQKSPFYVRPWIVFVVLVLAFAVFVGSKINAAQIQNDRETQYMDCLLDQGPWGDPSVCDHLNPDR